MVCVPGLCCRVLPAMACLCSRTAAWLICGRLAGRSCNCALRVQQCDGCETRNPRGDGRQRRVSAEDDYEAELKVKAAKKLLEEKEAALAAAIAEEEAAPKAAQITLEEIEAENALRAGRCRAAEPATTTTSIGALIDPDFAAVFAAPSTQPASMTTGEVWDPFGESLAAHPQAAAQVGDLLDFGAPQQRAPTGMHHSGECPARVFLRVGPCRAAQTHLRPILPPHDLRAHLSRWLDYVFELWG